ncbi:MAG: cupin domain-containing protein [Pseudomonadota bacterium]
MTVSMDEMIQRVVRYDDLIPCRTAFIDARTPGSDRKENFTIIGPGVSENPGQHIHIKMPHGFNVGGARQPAGCVNSQHSHETAEVFLVHSGVWAFRSGHDGTDGEVILHPGDVISIPVNVFRGFECLEGEDSFLFALLGGDDPGQVDWAPYVFEDAAGHGLVLTKAGRLIDTAIGETIPEGDEPCRPTMAGDVPRFRRLSSADLQAHVIADAHAPLCAETTLAARASGVREAPLLGPGNACEAVAAGKVSSEHGFHFRKLVFGAGGTIPSHAREEREVVFVHRGAITIGWGDHAVTLTAGDTATLPEGLSRQWHADDKQGAVVFVVRGTDSPAPPRWAEQAAHQAKGDLAAVV